MTVRVALDLARPVAGQGGRAHNRWHPAIPPIATVATGSQCPMRLSRTGSRLSAVGTNPSSVPSAAVNAVSPLRMAT